MSTATDAKEIVEFLTFRADNFFAAQHGRPPYYYESDAHRDKEAAAEILRLTRELADAKAYGDRECEKYLACVEFRGRTWGDVAALEILRLKARVEELETLETEARFLLARLSELEFSNIREIRRDFYGHVEPSISRLEEALGALTKGDAG